MEIEVAFLSSTQIPRSNNDAASGNLSVAGRKSSNASERKSAPAAGGGASVQIKFGPGDKH
jgi:hypothetical protein